MNQSLPVWHQKNCGFAPAFRQIATLSDEIKELQENKSMLRVSLDCHIDADEKEIAMHLQTIEENLVKLAEQRETLAVMRDDSITKFEAASTEVHSEDTAAVLDSRVVIRREHTQNLRQGCEKFSAANTISVS